MKDNNKLQFEIDGELIDEDAYLERLKKLFPNNEYGILAVNNITHQIEKLKSKQNEQYIS